MSIRIAAGIASVMAAIIAGVHTFLRYSERAEKHRSSSAKYGVLRREIEQNLAFPPSTPKELLDYVDSLRVRWDKLSDDSPTAPQRIWNKTEAEMRSIKSKMTDKIMSAKGAA